MPQPRSGLPPARFLSAMVESPIRWMVLEEVPASTTSSMPKVKSILFI